MEPLFDGFKEISQLLRNQVYTDETLLFNANNILTKEISKISSLIGYISEYDNKLHILNPLDKGKVIVISAIDGYRNISSSQTVGSIYGVYEYDLKNDKILSIVETGYVVYGHNTVLVKSNQTKLQFFYLTSNNKFEYHRCMRISSKGNIYSINEAYKYDKDIKVLIQYLKHNNFTQRWCGTMTADCHNILLNGGIFIYPNTENNPMGKITLLYKALPLSYIFSIIGGIGVDTNFKSILDKLPYIKLQNVSYPRSQITTILATKEVCETLRSYRNAQTNN